MFSPKYFFKLYLNPDINLNSNPQKKPIQTRFTFVIFLNRTCPSEMDIILKHSSWLLPYFEIEFALFYNQIEIEFAYV